MDSNDTKSESNSTISNSNETNSTDCSSMDNSTKAFYVNHLKSKVQSQYVQANIYNDMYYNYALMVDPLDTCNELWDYDTKGSDWECLCDTGDFQSPIDIISEEAEFYPMNVLFNYPNKFEATSAPSEIFNNGLGIVIKADLGNLVFPEGESVYNGYEINFHTPAEHSIDSSKLNMEMRLVYRLTKSKSKTAKSILMVVLLIDDEPNISNAFFDSLNPETFPEFKETKFHSGFLNFTSLFYDNSLAIADIVKTAFPHLEFDDNFPLSSFYTYDGSFTTPGCEEVVKYVVKADPIKISRNHFDAIKGKITKSSFSSEGNARSQQKKNNRIVRFYDKSKSNLDHTIEKYIALPKSADNELSKMKIQVGTAAKRLIASNYDVSEAMPNSDSSEIPRTRISSPIKQQLENFIQGGLFPGADDPLPQDMKVYLDKIILPPPPLTKEIMESGKPDVDIEEGKTK